MPNTSSPPTDQRSGRTVGSSGSGRVRIDSFVSSTTIALSVAGRRARTTWRLHAASADQHDEHADLHQQQAAVGGVRVGVERESGLAPRREHAGRDDHQHAGERDRREALRGDRPASGSRSITISASAASPPSQTLIAVTCNVSAGTASCVKVPVYA